MKFNKSTIYLFAFVILFIISCKDDDVVVSANEQVLFETFEYKVLPAETDNTITLGLEEQTAFISQNASDRKDRLFIFYPGTFGKPENYLKICKAAAEYGFYSFGISYKNDARITSYCENSTTVDCDKKVLQEFFNGTDGSNEVNISPSNSFTNKIIKMITYLQLQNPSENWNRFLDNNNEIIWSKVSIAGHSQGAAHALFTSKVVEVSRATFYSGPNAFEDSLGMSPTWFTESGATSDLRYTAFTNVNDNLFPYNYAQEVYKRLNIYGSPVSVEDSDFALITNIFTTDIIPANNPFSADPPHGSTAVDRVTPINADGSPKFREVWRFASFIE